ncbi:MAG TPA: ATP-binding protein [Bosea sp. (in: a-proteobacteria)]|uniref:sensor histidine kinase n=1 Tax=Bosea sp. (in: a-proteobacteria) TaxID=1871050 RepID=UPI002E0F25DD|nr:ATP-binding protein [Bosea sp. (in: a-proteobacteria)]
MPISQALFRRTNLLLMAAGIFALVVIVVSSLWLTLATERNFEDVVDARAVRSASADLMSLIQDAETGQRGFLLSRGDRAYLAPYTEALANYEDRFRRVAASVRELPDVEPQVAQLRATLDAKLAELAANVAMTETGDFPRAAAMVREGNGKVLMDAARAGFTRILERSEAALATAIAAQETTVTRLRWVTIIGAIVILGLAGAAAWTIIGYTGEIQAARRELEGLNVGLEERVRERTDALVKANEEIQRFAYIVTHDLRAPLVNIMGFTSELEATFQPIGAYFDAEGPQAAELKADAEQALKTDVPEALEFIRSSTRKMDGLINAILKISREGSRSLKPERLQLGAQLEAAAAAVHHQASETGGGITVDAKVDSIVSDRLSLDQIFGNLLDNAIKYRAPDRPLDVIARTRNGRTGWVKIEIEDNGRGIAAGDHERIFELFRRSGTQNTPGEGIGLAHVRTLVRNLGGDITVKSEFGVGTTFTILLPADLRTVKRSNQS